MKPKFLCFTCDQGQDDRTSRAPQSHCKSWFCCMHCTEHKLIFHFITLLSAWWMKTNSKWPSSLNSLMWGSSSDTIVWMLPSFTIKLKSMRITYKAESNTWSCNYMFLCVNNTVTCRQKQCLSQKWFMAVRGVPWTRRWPHAMCTRNTLQSPLQGAFIVWLQTVKVITQNGGTHESKTHKWERKNDVLAGKWGSSYQGIR